MLPQLTVGSEGRVKILGPSYLILDEFECIFSSQNTGRWQNEMTFMNWIGMKYSHRRFQRKAISFFPRFFIRSVILLLFNEAI